VKDYKWKKAYKMSGKVTTSVPTVKKDHAPLG
jgi:hypothetical protein